ncbi:MAG: hypothetical protein HYT08_01690 [Candidatus Levybacteria bacterium]|nr:hypothetical protein [Candidatus Levybacteria bacterium]
MKKRIQERGQALITFLYIMIIGMTISSASAVIMLINLMGGGTMERGEITYYIAESGIENAILKLLRDPDYSGETLSVGGGNVTTEITSQNPLTIVATGRYNNIVRKIEVQTLYNNNVLTISSWREIN